MSLPNAGPGDIAEAAHRYQPGESLATLGTVLGVNTATVRRKKNQAEVTIQKRRD